MGTEIESAHVTKIDDQSDQDKLDQSLVDGVERVVARGMEFVSRKLKRMERLAVGSVRRQVEWEPAWLENQVRSVIKRG